VVASANNFSNNGLSTSQAAFKSDKSFTAAAYKFSNNERTSSTTYFDPFSNNS